MNFEKFFDLGYLFKFNPGGRFSFYIPLIIFFVIMAVLGFATKHYIRYKKDTSLKKLFKNVPKRLWQFVIAGFFLLIFRQQNIPLASMRILLILLVIGMVAYIGKIAYQYWKVYPGLLKKEKELAKKKKYMP